MNTRWLRFSWNLVKKARADFKNVWSGDDRLPYQGWLGKVAKHQPEVAVALLASFSVNAAWFVFFIKSKLFDAWEGQILEAGRTFDNWYSFVYIAFTILGWVFSGFAILFTGMWLLGMISIAGLWLLDELKSDPMNGPEKGERSR